MIHKDMCINQTQAYPISESIFRIVTPFQDGSSFEMLIKKDGNKLIPCNLTSTFIYTSIDESLRCKIQELCTSKEVTSSN